MPRIMPQKALQPPPPPVYAIWDLLDLGDGIEREQKKTIFTYKRR